MRANVIAVLSALTLLSACGKDTQPESAPLPLPTGPAAVKPEPTASAAPAPRAEAPKKAPRKPKLPKDFESLLAELRKKCGPKEVPQDNVSTKEAAHQEAECMRRKMVADLDAVLLPLKSSDPARFSQLMKEQAVWNRFVKSQCWIEEELQWLDLTTGQRDDGTMRSYAYLGCLMDATAERTLYARALANKDPGAVEKRVKAREKLGAEADRSRAELLTKAQGFEKSPPKVEPGMVEADWKKIIEEAKASQDGATELATMTCEGWKELGGKLGDKRACEASMRLYYLGHGTVEEEPK
ncbi:lysozyme inhibitor LprI family protein [Polyangium aurulentum]|uniref:lysozyme inhibitor LprI family protein n=1 Tax=Polyangium aurulentum TaxID=2567896 RepID=UPI0010ADC6D1|nr:lysozyme inhibitor LprI family protein [Polyangium aurulentum]UQA55305.1 DUF1311 domain-containing protein [Polyangium aurulentum]